MGNRDLALERLWRKRVREHEKSGLTVGEFCEREDLVDHQLAWWRRELKRRDAKVSSRKKKSTRIKPRKRQPTATASKFVPVQVTSSGSSSVSIEVVLDQPVRIAVSPGFDPQVLADVVRALERRSC